MAKLSGVKTLDMVNGEITKVAYAGAEYEKVGRGLSEVKPGDLFMADDYASAVLTGGGFYLITAVDNTKDCSVRFIDEADDSNGYSPKCPIHTHFRKVASEPAYFLIPKSEAQVGDYVVFAEDDDLNDIYISAGKYYEITGIGYGGDFAFTDDVGDGNTAVNGWDDYAVYRKQTELVASEAPTLKAGDYAKVIKGAPENFGKIVLIIENVGHNVRVREVNPADGDRIVFSPIKLLKPATEEEVAAAKQAKAERAKWAKIGRKVGEYKKGDVVQMLDASAGNLSNGDIGEIGASDTDGTYRVNTAKVTHGNWYLPKQFRLITPVESRFDTEEGE